MFDDYDHFHADLERTLKEDMVWTCWTKNGKASQKFGIILLTDIAYGLSAEIHGAVDKTFLREKRKHSIIDKTTREVIKFAFNDLGVARINATFYEKNPLVLGFLKRHGFKRNAILKKSVYIGEEIRDTFIYGLIEDDFLKENKNVKET